MNFNNLMKFQNFFKKLIKCGFYGFDETAEW